MIVEKLKPYIKGDTYCDSTYGKLQDFCDWRSCPSRYIHDFQMKSEHFGSFGYGR